MELFHFWSPHISLYHEATWACVAKFSKVTGNRSSRFVCITPDPVVRQNKYMTDLIWVGYPQIKWRIQPHNFNYGIITDVPRTHKPLLLNPVGRALTLQRLSYYNQNVFIRTQNFTERDNGKGGIWLNMKDAQYMDTRKTWIHLVKWPLCESFYHEVACASGVTFSKLVTNR